MTTTHPPRAVTAACLAAALLLSGCAGGSDASGPAAGTSSAVPGAGAVQSTALPTSAPSRGSSLQGVAGTVVRFTAGDAAVDVTIGEDTPAVRDFLSMLPMTLELKEFNGREKIADLPRELRWQGSPGSDPQDGDLIYYVPWGNIGFYYNTAGIGYSDQTLHLGTYRASREELSRFEGRQTRVEVVD